MTKGALRAVVLLTIAIGLGFWRLEVLSHRGDQAARALCAVQASTREQIRQSVQFLADIKAGKRPPIQGISETDILAGIVRQQKFLKALDILNC
jgi:hypothetical protein